MKKQTKLLTIVLFAFTICAFAQDEKNEILGLITDYGDNYEKPNYNQEFVEAKLSPALEKIEKMTCEGNDFGLFDNFLKMILKTKASANNELTVNVLGGVFICKPEVVDKYLTQVYKDKFFVDLLELGFKNRTFNRESEIKNYKMLEKKLKRLKNQ